jgi:hypothetical protein
MKKLITLMIAAAICFAAAIGAAQGASPPLDSKVKITVPCETSIVAADEVSNLEIPVITSTFKLQKRFKESRMAISERSPLVAEVRQERRLSFYRWRHEKPNYHAVLNVKNYNFVLSTNFQSGVLPLRT